MALFQPGADRAHVWRGDAPQRKRLSEMYDNNERGLAEAVSLLRTTKSLSFLDLLYLSTSLLWWHAVAALRGGTSSKALRMHAPCTWRRRTGLPNVYHTAIRRA